MLGLYEAAEEIRGVVRWHEEVGVALEDWAETAEALAHAASHWKRNGDVLSGNGL